MILESVLQRRKNIDENDLLKLMSGLQVKEQIADKEEIEPLKVVCKCTRKCQTKACPCFESKTCCNKSCHIGNNNCTNK